MGATYLIDTNAIADYLGAIVSVNALDFMDTVMDNAPTMSVINKIELLGQTRPSVAQFGIAVDACQIIGITDEIVEKTIALRKNRRIKIPDALIAATALVYNLTLITHNLSDFETIPGLNLIDLHTIT